MGPMNCNGTRPFEARILRDVCRRHEIPASLLAGLLALERATRRWGINNAIAERIRTAVNGGGARGDEDPVGDAGPAANGADFVEEGRDLADDEIRFVSLRLRNFSVFADACVRFRVDPARPLVLLEAGNGHGKTTLLDALRFLLHNRTPADFARILHRDAPRPEARVEVELRLHSARDGEVLARRFVDLEHSAGRWAPARRPVFVVKVGDIAMQDDDAEAWVAERLPRHVLDYFVFDAETSPVLALAAEGPAGDVAEALEQVLGISPVRDLSRRLKDLVTAIDRRIQESSDRPSERQVAAALEGAEADLERTQQNLDLVGSQLRSLLEDKRKVEADLDLLLRRFDPAEDAAWTTRERATADLRRREEEACKALPAACGDLPLRILADHVRYAVRLARRSRMDEREAAWSRGAWDAVRRVAGLAAAGRLPWAEDPMPPPDAIAERLSMLLELSDPDDTLDGSSLSEARAAALESLVARSVARPLPAQILMAIRGIRAELRRQQAPGAEGVVAGAETVDRSDLRQQHATLSAEKERIVRRAAQLEARKADLDKLLGERAVDVAAQRGKLTSARTDDARVRSERAQRELAARVAACADALAGALREARVEALETGATGMFRATTNKPELYDAIRFDRETLRYRVVGHDGRTAPPERSTGERAVLALAVVHGLLVASGRSLPLLVEAPLKTLDPEHTEKVLRHFYSGRQGQVVMLVKPDEVPPALRPIVAARVGHHLVVRRPDPEREVSTIEDVESAL
jgi:DNA sulfur modification protein DndD